MMRPRIYRIEISDNSSISVFNNIDELEFEQNQALNTKIIYDLGFKSVNIRDLETDIKKLPFGVYISKSFANARPGEEWSYTSEVYELGSVLGVHALKASPLNGILENAPAIEFLESYSKNELTSNTRIDRLEPKQEYLFNMHRWSERAKNVLNRQNIRTVQQLLEVTYTEMATWRNCGQKTLQEIEEFKSNFGEDQSKQRIIQDYYLFDFEWSARTMKFLDSRRISKLSELIKLSKREMLETPKIGRLTVAEIESFLDEHHLSFESSNSNIAFVKPEIQPITLSSSIAEDLTVQLEQAKTNPKHEEIFKHRTGLFEYRVLEEISSQFNVTRQRIEQLQYKFFQRLWTKPDSVLPVWLSNLSERVEHAGSTVLLTDFIQNSEIFDGLHDPEKCLKFMIWCDKKFPIEKTIPALHIINFASQTYISNLNQDEVDSIWKFVRGEFSKGQNNAVREIYKNIEPFITQKQMKLFEVMFSNCCENSVIDLNDEDEEVLLKPFSNSEVATVMQKMRLAIKSSNNPIKTKDLLELFEIGEYTCNFNSAINLLHHEPDVYQSSHGEWSDFDKLNISLDETKVLTEIASKLANERGKKGFHSREVNTAAEKHLKSRLSEFQVSAVIKTNGKFITLGRNYFCSSKYKNAERPKIKDLVEEVLRLEGAPMHITDILDIVSRRRSIDKKMIFSAVPPIINLGNNILSLEYWE